MQEQILMQVRTTGGNEGWHNQLKRLSAFEKIRILLLEFLRPGRIVLE
jgi:hypothetical protein